MKSTLSLFVLTMSIMVGCGGPAGPKLNPVTGKVSGGTGSLEGCLVVFNPVDTKTPSSSGLVKADGTFTLECTNGKPGAAVGKYKITMSLGPDATKKMMEAMATKGPQSMPMGPRPGMPGGQAGGPPQMPGMEPPFPKEYSSITTTTKEVEVKAGPNEIPIAL